MGNFYSRKIGITYKHKYILGKNNQLSHDKHSNRGTSSNSRQNYRGQSGNKNRDIISGKSPGGYQK